MKVKYTTYWVSWDRQSFNKKARVARMRMRSDRLKQVPQRIELRGPGLEWAKTLSFIPYSHFYSYTYVAWPVAFSLELFWAEPSGNLSSSLWLAFRIAAFSRIWGGSLRSQSFLLPSNIFIGISLLSCPTGEATGSILLILTPLNERYSISWQKSYLSHSPKQIDSPFRR